MKTYYYVLVTKQGLPATHDHKLPIYWNKEVAIDDAVKFNKSIRRIGIDDLKKIIQ